MSALEQALVHAATRKDDNLAEFRDFVAILSVSNLSAHKCYGRNS